MPCGVRLLLSSLSGSYVCIAVYAWMPSWICSVSVQLNWNYVSQIFLSRICLSRIDYKRNLHSIWKVEIKHLPFLGLGVREKFDVVVAHEPCHSRRAHIAGT